MENTIDKDKAFLLNIFSLASKMLKLASDEFSNKGCNDLEQSVIDSIKDKAFFLEQFREWHGDDFPEVIESIEDSTLMKFLSKELSELSIINKDETKS